MLIMSPQIGPRKKLPQIEKDVRLERVFGVVQLT